jgi:hypothetical protein
MCQKGTEEGADTYFSEQTRRAILDDVHVANRRALELEMAANLCALAHTVGKHVRWCLSAAPPSMLHVLTVHAPGNNNRSWRRRRARGRPGARCATTGRCT